MKMGVLGTMACAALFLFAAGSAISAENKEAMAEFKKAKEKIDDGNAAMREGDEAAAYCLFDEAIWRLEAIRKKYPDWEKESVTTQLKNIKKVKDKLKATTCKILGGMKEDQFRFQVWERQVLTLDKLDKVINMLSYITEEQDKNQEYIKDIRDRLDEGK